MMPRTQHFSPSFLSPTGNLPPRIHRRLCTTQNFYPIPNVEDATAQIPVDTYQDTSLRDLLPGLPNRMGAEVVVMNGAVDGRGQGHQVRGLGIIVGFARAVKRAVGRLRAARRG